MSQTALFERIGFSIIHCRQDFRGEPIAGLNGR